MSADVVPVLNDRINRSFQKNVMKDRQIANVTQRIRDGTARLEDAHRYAQHLGEDLSKALVDNLTVDNLPNGRLYYNIAQRTVVPALENNYNLVNDTADQIQKIANKKNKIGLGAVRADFPSERIQGLIDKMTSKDVEVTDIITWLKEPIVNNSEAFFDDFIQANSKFQSDAGLKVKLIRKAESKCCEWCQNLEGSYDYGNAPDDIYRRHEFCRCTTTYESKKKSQNVWSKKQWTTPKEDLEKRQSAGQRQEMTLQERISQLEQLERDKELQNFIKETGFSRASARRATRKKTPEQVQAEINKIKEMQETLRR